MSSTAFSFQLTASCEADLTGMPPRELMKVFQLTASREADPLFPRSGFLLSVFQFTASCEADHLHNQGFRLAASLSTHSLI